MSQDAEFPTLSFETASDFEAFLAREHVTAPGIFLKLAKKNSGITSISSGEAIEVALCYGWIDGRTNGIDESWWAVRYTPRRAKSIWSQKNVGTVARLIEEGRMRPAGLAAVEAAKTDGRWDRAYSGGANITVPDDLKEALAAEPAADAFWKSLKKTERFATLHRLETASDAARAKKIDGYVNMLAAGQIPGAPSTASKTKSKSKAKVTKDGVKKTKSSGSRASSLQGDDQKASRRAGLRQRKSQDS